MLPLLDQWPGYYSALIGIVVFVANESDPAVQVRVLESLHVGQRYGKHRSGTLLRGVSWLHVLDVCATEQVLQLIACSRIRLSFGI